MYGKQQRPYLEEKLDILNILELDKFERDHRTIQLTGSEDNILQSFDIL